MTRSILDANHIVTASKCSSADFAQLDAEESFNMSHWRSRVDRRVQEQIRPCDQK